jgi:hypothetical protein
MKNFIQDPRRGSTPRLPNPGSTCDARRSHCCFSSPVRIATKGTKRTNDQKIGRVPINLIFCAFCASLWLTLFVLFCGLV